MSKRYSFYLTLSLVFLLAGCKQKNKSTVVSKPHCTKQATLPVKYAKGFTVDYYNGFKVINVWSTEDTVLLARYILKPAGKGMPIGFEKALSIDTPVQEVVCIATNHVAYFEKLNLLEAVAGVTNSPLIYSPVVQEKLGNGHIQSVGSNEFDFEKIAALHPSFVLSSGSYDSGDKLPKRLEALNIRLVLCRDFAEQNPLARAEWLKFIAAFYDREAEADSVFSVIEKNYLQLKAKAASVTQRPTVFCNMPFKEVWYMPTANNYTARLIADAGGDFLWNNAQSTNGLNQSLDYEAVFAKAAGADIWLVNSLATSAEEVKGADTKNALFNAFKKGTLYNFDRRRTPSGGTDYWESGCVNPDIILGDLLYIFHPDLLPAHQLYYYRQLH